MGLLDLLGCKHEFVEIGRYKKLKCSKCNQEIMVKE
jgi:DNA-directed RNA polymerase subunit RPC12/RpoP